MLKVCTIASLISFGEAPLAHFYDLRARHKRSGKTRRCLALWLNLTNLVDFSNFYVTNCGRSLDDLETLPEA
jgi:hypothetical protein